APHPPPRDRDVVHDRYGRGPETSTVVRKVAGEKPILFEHEIEGPEPFPCEPAERVEIGDELAVRDAAYGRVVAHGLRPDAGLDLQDRHVEPGRNVRRAAERDAHVGTLAERARECEHVARRSGRGDEVTPRCDVTDREPLPDGHGVAGAGCSTAPTRAGRTSFAVIVTKLGQPNRDSAYLLAEAARRFESAGSRSSVVIPSARPSAVGSTSSATRSSRTDRCAGMSVATIARPLCR